MKESPTLRTLFELSGVVPLTLYALVHVASYASVLFGRESFGAPRANGAALLMELGLVWLPLAFHSGYAVWSLRAAPPAQAGERRSWLFSHLSGAATLIFLVSHTLWLRLPLWRGERSPEDVRQMLAAGLSATTSGVPLVAALHLVGVAAVAFHVDVGLVRFAEHFGLLAESTARRLARVTALTLFASGAATIVHFATGSALPSFLR